VDYPSIFVFLQSVIVGHWIPIVLGGIPQIVELGYKQMSGKDISFNIYLRVITAGGIFLAVFLAWSEEYAARISLEKEQKSWNAIQSLLRQKTDEVSEKNEEIRDLRFQLKEKQRDYTLLQDRLNDKEKEVIGLQQKNNLGSKRKKIREQLGIFLNSGSMLKANILNGNNDLGADDVSKWGHQVIDYLQKEFGLADVDEFLHPPVLPPYGHGIDRKRNDLVNAMEGHLHVLRQLTKQLGSDIQAVQN